MSQALQTYIERARKQGHKPDQIEADLIEAGWSADQIAFGLKDLDTLMPPPPPSDSHNQIEGNNHRHRDRPPQSVVTTFTTRGLEYLIMFIALGVTALSLGSVLHSTINTLAGTEGISDGVVSFATSALIVALPVFAILFLRLKRAELKDPELHDDSSRRRGVQLMLIVTFLVGLGNIIYYLYTVLNGGTGRSYNVTGEMGTNGVWWNTVHLAVTLAIAGGIFVYYWIDDHREHHA